MAALLVGMLATKPAVAQAPKQNSNDDYVSGPLVIKNDAIQPPEATPIYSNNAGAKPVPKQTGGQRTTPYEGRHYSKEEVESLIRDYAVLYGVNPELAVRIAWCESGYNQFSKNNSSSASGVYQYLSSTWSNTPEGRLGTSVFDAEANIRMAISSIAAHGTAPWLASKACWNK